MVSAAVWVDRDSAVITPNGSHDFFNIYFLLSLFARHGCLFFCLGIPTF
jgi:hypothetical protein